MLRHTADPRRRSGRIGLGAKLLVGACAFITFVTAGVVVVQPSAVSAASTTLASDQFNRRISAGWGKAAEGGDYQELGRSASFAVDGNAGRVTLSSGTRDASALLPEVRVRDVDVVFRFSVNRTSSSGDYWIWAVARRQGSSEYRVGVHVHRDATITSLIKRVVNGRSITIKANRIPGARFSRGTDYWIRVQVVHRDPSTIRI
jgi:hypothetical protein